MKLKKASTLGFALIVSGVLIPWQSVDAVMFTPPPNEATPAQGTGGASRGGLFVPAKGESAPTQATGGASRTDLFAPPSDSGTLTRATGGASRTDLFAPPSDSATPTQGTSGGASRNDLFAPPPDSATPNEENVQAGASREGRRYLNNIAINQPKAILALLPQTYFGTTVSEEADILVYLPQSMAREGVFSIKDERGNTLHQMNVPVSGRSGVISIKVPINLELEKNYQWFLALKIDGQLSPRTPYVSGWIKRIKPNQEISTSMEQKDLLKQATALGKHGVWYDCVAALAKLRAIQPNNTNLDREWSELLTSVGLKQIEQAPVMAFNNISN